MISLAGFLVRRLLAIAVLVLAVTLAAFALFRIGVRNAATDAQINQQLGAGRPASWQYLHYLLRLLHGNLGETLTPGLSVGTVLRRALPPTLSLMVGAMVLWLVAGVVAGTVSALGRGSWADRVITGAVAVPLAVPTFLVAALLLYVFSYLARFGNLWLQPGYVPITQSPGQWLGRMILPWVAVAATQAGITARLMRGAVLETLGEDYIRLARAKGLPEHRLLLRHAAWRHRHRRPGIRARRHRTGPAGVSRQRRPHGHHGNRAARGDPHFAGQPHGRHLPCRPGPASAGDLKPLTRVGEVSGP